MIFLTDSAPCNIQLPKQLESVTAAQTFPRVRHRWNTNEVCENFTALFQILVTTIFSFFTTCFQNPFMFGLLNLEIVWKAIWPCHRFNEGPF